MSKINALKRIVAVTVAVMLVVGMLPTSVFAVSENGAKIRVTKAVPYTGAPVSSINIEKNAQAVNAPRYSDDEMVTAIVQLDGPAVLDSYNAVAPVSFMSAGSAVSEYLASPAAKSMAAQITAEQNQVAAEISAIPVENGGIPAPMASFGGGEVISQWTNTVNAMAVRVPYGKLDEIKAIPGVKTAYVSHTFEAPETVEDIYGPAGYGYDMVNLSEAWEAGYTGQGMVVAILDTGLDLSHQAFQANSFKSANSVSFVKYDEARIAALIAEHELQAEKIIAAGDSMENVYKSKKVPYAFDYAGSAKPNGLLANGDTDVVPDLSADSNHGTHVAGTVAGYAKTPEGAVEHSGIAPDAQLMILKVFNDQGSMTDEYMLVNAIEDAVFLGADVINLSLGSDNGFSEDDTIEPGIFRSIEKAGVTSILSAGNSGTVGYNNIGTGYGTDYFISALVGSIGSFDPANMDVAMVGSPSTYGSTISVAAVNNTMSANATVNFNIGEQTGAVLAPYTDNAVRGWVDTFGTATAPIPLYRAGIGSLDDYANSAFADPSVTGIALVQRGTENFFNKVYNAEANYPNVLGVIVYDNVVGDLINMANSDDTLGIVSTLPAIFISMADGDALAAAIEAGTEVTMLPPTDEISMFPSTSGGTMCDFSSWGPTPNLELKPEIAAPGGNIYSATFGNSYTLMNGTSMAAPHISGLSALARQAVAAKNPGAGIDFIRTTAEKLLISTAEPLVESVDETTGAITYYSPRQQGAGMANIGAAVTSDVYLDVPGKKVPKLELGDDPDYTGTLNLDFDVVNMGSAPITYEAKIIVNAPGFINIAESPALAGAFDEYYIGLDVPITIAEKSLGQVVAVPGTTHASFTYTVEPEDMLDLEHIFPNGFFIDGFVRLIPVTASAAAFDPMAPVAEEIPEVGLPFLSYQGDWTAAPIFDTAVWNDLYELDENGEAQDLSEGVYNSFWYDDTIDNVTMIYSIITGTTQIFPLGINPLSMGEQNYVEYGVPFYNENMTLSPNGDGYFDLIDYYQIIQNRDAKLLVLQVKNKKTGEIYYSHYESAVAQTFFNPSYGIVFPDSYYFDQDGWDGTDASGKVLPSNTECVYTIAAFGDGNYQYDADGSIILPANFSLDDETTWPTFGDGSRTVNADFISFDVTVDTEGPDFGNGGNVTITDDRENSGLITIEGTIVDDHAYAGMEVYPAFVDSNGDVQIDSTNMFYSDYTFDPGVKETEFCIESDFDYYGLYDWQGDVVVALLDYGLNETDYVVNIFEDFGIDSFIEADYISENKSAFENNEVDGKYGPVFLYGEGDTDTLFVTVTPAENECDFTWTSSDETIATVAADADDTAAGVITAKAPGCAIITAADEVTGQEVYFILYVFGSDETTALGNAVTLEDYVNKTTVKARSGDKLVLDSTGLDYLDSICEYYNEFEKLEDVPGELYTDIVWTSDSEDLTVAADGTITADAAIEEPVTVTAEISLKYINPAREALTPEDEPYEKTYDTVAVVYEVTVEQGLTPSDDDSVVTGETEDGKETPVYIMGAGAGLTLSAKGPDGKTLGDLEWSSSDPSVATVDPETGAVTGVSAGTAEITATDPVTGETVTFTVVIVGSDDTTANSQTVAPAGGNTYNVSIVVGATDKLSIDEEVIADLAAIAEATGGSYSVSWTASNPDYVTVDENGFITGVKHTLYQQPGKVTAKVTLTDASGKVVSEIEVVYNVTVDNANEPHIYHNFRPVPVDEFTHTMICFECGLHINNEPHQFYNGRCTVCGYAETYNFPFVGIEPGYTTDTDTGDQQQVDVDAPTDTTTQNTDTSDDETDVGDTEAPAEEESNPKTGIAFGTLSLAVAAVVAMAVKRR